MTDLFTRHSDTPVEPARIRTDEKGRPFVVTVENCRRCGGAGGWQGWPDFTCYRCAGSGKEQPRDERVYTRDQNAKLDATADKRRAAKTAKADAAYAATRAAFEVNHAALLATIPVDWLAGAERVGACDPTSEAARESGLPREAFTVADIVFRGRRFGSISEKQAALITQLVDGYAARIASQAKRVATSQFVGKVSERLTLAVTCVRVSSYEREDRFSGWGSRTETVHICQFEDASGNVLVTKSPRFVVEKGAVGTLVGTVKQHDIYRELKQTTLQRASFTPVAE